MCGWVVLDGVCACADLMATSGVGLLAPTSRVNSNVSTKEAERSQLEKEALVSPRAALPKVLKLITTTTN